MAAKCPKSRERATWPSSRAFCSLRGLAGRLRSGAFCSDMVRCYESAPHHCFAMEQKLEDDERGKRPPFLTLPWRHLRDVLPPRFPHRHPVERRDPPAGQAGRLIGTAMRAHWIPACAGMTTVGVRKKSPAAQNPRLASKSSTSLWSATTSVRPVGSTTGPFNSLDSAILAGTMSAGAT